MSSFYVIFWQKVSSFSLIFRLFLGHAEYLCMEFVQVSLGLVQFAKKLHGGFVKLAGSRNGRDVAYGYAEGAVEKQCYKVLHRVFFVLYFGK